MNEQDSVKMTPLDQMVAEDQLQILKAAIPYASPNVQSMLSILAKALELQRTIQLFSHSQEISMMSEREPAAANPMEMLQSISQFASGEMKENLNHVMTAFSAVQMFQMYQEEGQTPEMEKEEESNG